MNDVSNYFFTYSVNNRRIQHHYDKGEIGCGSLKNIYVNILLFTEQKTHDLRGEAVDRSTSSIWTAPAAQKLCAY